MTGMDGIQGRLGPTGPPGPIGLTGWGGWGNVGPVGNPNFNLSQVSSGTSITATTASLGTTYYITTAGITGITLPVSMSGITAGAFWMFQNSTASALNVTLTSGTATYSGNSNSGPISIPSGSAITLVYSGTGTGYIVF
jgi:hypothetical protein